MTVRWLILSAILTAGCGSSPTAPSPQPIPSPTPTPAPPPTFTGSVTDTVTGAPISGFTALLVGSRLTLSALGYLTRETANASAVDLIPEAAPFDLGFYRQLVRNGFEAPGSLEPVRRLTQAPSIYLQSAGLSAATVAALENAARNAVYEFSGQTMGVVSFESGTELRPNANGWIVIELIADASANCGRATIGASAGHVWLNTVDRCRRDGTIISGPAVLAHEIGHTMGFWHVATGLMSTPTAPTAAITALERYHASIAYHRPIGNKDVDVDGSTSISAARVVVD